MAVVRVGMLPIEPTFLHGILAGWGSALIAVAVYDQYRDLQNAIAKRRELSAEHR